MNTGNDIIFAGFRLALVLIILFAGQDASSRIQFESLQEGKLIKAPLDSLMYSMLDAYADGEPPGEPPLAGFAVPVSISAEDIHCTQTDSLNICLFMINSPGAKAVGINFSDFRPGPGGRIFIYDTERTMILGPYDQSSTTGLPAFTTPPLPGETIIIEYQSLSNGFLDSGIRVESIIHISGSGDTEKGISDSGDCNVNINCEEGKMWQREKRGVVRMLMRVGSNYFWCTGSLVNNTARDATPFLLSAYHCGRNADNDDLNYWQFFFNFERPYCSNEGSPVYNMLYGAELVAEGPIAGGSDFRLLVLDTPPPPHWKPFWNGWDISGEISGPGVSIHHPSGDVKKISTYTTDLLTTTPIFSGVPMATNSAWGLTWSETDNGHGVTEAGSSGAPLFSSDKKIIGTLSGGAASCSNLTGRDYFGKMSYHWDLNDKEPTSGLKAFLDPLETGTESLAGFDPYSEMLPPPGFLTAYIYNADTTIIKWYKPGKAPNNQGWYRYFEDYSHFSWAGPERATMFDPAALGLNYPVQINKLAHSFVEGGEAENKWPDDRFRFRIYDSDGITELYESGILKARHLSEYIYELDSLLEFHRPFYVSVKPLDHSGHPSSLMQRVNLGWGNSFFGSAGNWTPHDDSREGSYAYHSAIYVMNKTDKTTVETHYKIIGERRDHKTLTGMNTMVEKIIPPENTEPDSYMLFRNDTLIHTSSEGQPLEYADPVYNNSIVRYHVRAGYQGRVSEPSNKVYLINPGSCAERISQWPYQEVFDYSFDESCWLTYNISGNGWILSDTAVSEQGYVLPYSGDLIWTSRSMKGEETDQWLIMPEIDFTGLRDPALRFMFNTGAETEGDTDNLEVWISRQGNALEKIWDIRSHPMIPAGWQPVNLRLEGAGGTDRNLIAFRHKGNIGEIFSIDNLGIFGSAGISHELRISVEPEFAGIVKGQGKYIEGEIIRLKASPNIAYIFSRWVAGNTMIGNEEEMWFSMPSSNQHITAFFLPVEETSLEEPISNSLLRVFPNPAKDHIWINFGNTLDFAELKLVNTYGQTVLRRVIENITAGESKLIRTNGLKPGTYLLRVNSVETYEVFRLIIVN